MNLLLIYQFARAFTLGKRPKKPKTQVKKQKRDTMDKIIESLQNHDSYSICCSKYIEEYIYKPNFKNNIKARIAYVGIILISNIEAIIAISSSIFFFGIYFMTLCRISEFKIIGKETFRISLFNKILSISSLVGSIIHPQYGISIINKITEVLYQT